MIIIQPNIITVDHEELVPSPHEEYTAQGLMATRTLRCRWQDRNRLAEQLLGFSYASGNDVVYRLPHPYPGQNQIVARSARVRPFGDHPSSDASDSVLRYSTAELEVRYQSSEQGSGDETQPGVDVFIEENLESTSEYLVFQNEVNVQVEGDPEPRVETVIARRLVIGLTWRVTQRMVPVIPPAALLLTGRINDREIRARTLNVTFPTHTLLYQGFQATRNTMTDGRVTRDLTYLFHYRPEGWQKVWVPGVSEMVPMLGPTGQPLKLYEEGNFLWL